MVPWHWQPPEEQSLVLSFTEVAKTGSDADDGGVADLLRCIWLAQSCWTTEESFQSATVDIGVVDDSNVGAFVFSCKSVLNMPCTGSTALKVSSTGM